MTLQPYPTKLLCQDPKVVFFTLSCSHLAQPSQLFEIFASLQSNPDFEVLPKIRPFEFICHFAHISNLRKDWALDTGPQRWLVLLWNLSQTWNRN